LPEHHFRYGTIAIGLDIIALQLDRACERRDRGLSPFQTEQGVAKIPQRCWKIRLQREGLFKAGAGFVVALEVEQRKTEIGVSIRRALVEGDRALENSLRILEPLAFEYRNAQQMHCVKAIGFVPEQAPAKRLNILVPAFSIGGGGSQQRLRLFPEFLLLLRARDGAGADGALQGLFSGRISEEEATTGHRGCQRSPAVLGRRRLLAVI
jgi:hypothetical protein